MLKDVKESPCQTKDGSEQEYEYQNQDCLPSSIFTDYNGKKHERVGVAIRWQISCISGSNTQYEYAIEYQISPQRLEYNQPELYTDI